MNREAAITIGAVEALVLAAIPILARVFGWDLDLQDDITVLAIAAVAVLVPLIGAAITRIFVWSQQSHDAAVKKALHRLPPEDGA